MLQFTSYQKSWESLFYKTLNAFLGPTTYTENTPYGYSVRVYDEYITDINTNSKIGLYRQMSAYWALPFIDFIIVNTDPHMGGGGGGGCGYKARQSYYFWQDLFQYEKGATS